MRDLDNRIFIKDLLTKLGTAIYLHKEQIKVAEKGKEAIDYLAKHGIFTNAK